MQRPRNCWLAWGTTSRVSGEVSHSTVYPGMGSRVGGSIGAGQLQSPRKMPLRRHCQSRYLNIYRVRLPGAMFSDFDFPLVRSSSTTRDANLLQTTIE